jgi:hypothetical protein
VSPTKVELAVLNNTRWYEAMFAAHALQSETDDRVWRSHESPPPFHSNLVVLSPMTTQAEIEAYAAEIDRQRHPSGWSLKDSYACLDLSSRGFIVLFEAKWIWRDPIPVNAPVRNSRLSWTKLATPSSLAEWEQAWQGDTKNETEVLRSRQFPDSLLSSPDHSFFAGRFEGKVVAGGIANRSPGVMGLSNTFSPPEFREDTWTGLVSSLSAAFPRTPIVGYERGADLNFAESAGFVPIGELRIWCRST